MAAKKPIKKRKASLDTILATVEHGFANLEGKMERGFAAVADDIADIRNTMATKDDIVDVRKEMATKEDIAGIMSELGDIKTRLKAIEAAVEDHAGHSKEIDHALERIAAIEKHLSINKKIAA